ncbi:MAG: DHHA1 domain-containing protein [Pyrobaculum sp.]
MLEVLKELLKGVRKAAIVTHKRADADALACAYVVKLVLEKLGVESGPVVCPEGSPLGGCVEEVPNDVDAYVLADVASLAQVPPLRGRLVKIDHHAAGDEVPGVWDNRPSCTEVALQLAEEAGVEIPPEVARLAVLGIYTDSGKLRRADAKTLQHLSKLLGALGATLGEVVAEDGRRAEHEVIALLKGLKRVAVYRSSVGLICASHVGAYESEVASLLVALGCRVALVASRKKDGVHVSMRSRDYDVSALAKRLGGGGHKEAAVAVIGEKISKDKLHRLLREIVREIDPDARPLV